MRREQEQPVDPVVERAVDVGVLLLRKEQQVVVQLAHGALQAREHLLEERVRDVRMIAGVEDDAEQLRALPDERSRSGVRDVVELPRAREHACAGVLAHPRRPVEDARDGGDRDAAARSDLANSPPPSRAPPTTAAPGSRAAPAAAPAAGTTAPAAGSTIAPLRVDGPVGPSPREHCPSDSPGILIQRYASTSGLPVFAVGREAERRGRAGCTSPARRGYDVGRLPRPEPVAARVDDEVRRAGACRASGTRDAGRVQRRVRRRVAPRAVRARARRRSTRRAASRSSLGSGPPFQYWFGHTPASLRRDAMQREIHVPYWTAFCAYW